MKSPSPFLSRNVGLRLGWSLARIFHWQPWSPDIQVCWIAGFQTRVRRVVPTPCQFGNRRYRRFGNLRHVSFARVCQSNHEISGPLPMKFLTLLLITTTLLALPLSLRAQPGGVPDEPSLIAVLQSDQKSAHDKDAACAQLKRTGTEAAIPALAGLLIDDQLSHSARYALESMPSAKAGEALLQALPKTAGANRIGIINSLGERAEKSAVTTLIACLADTDATTAMAAAEALGKIGGPEAQKALDKALNQAAGPRLNAVMDALLRCATATPDRAEFKKLYETGKGEALRVAAYRGWIQASGSKALDLVTRGVLGQDSAAQTAALQLAREIQAPGATAALAKMLTQVPGPVQISLVEALEQRDDAAATPAILALTRQADPDVRVACLNALGNLGDETAVVTLAKFAAEGEVAEKKAARAALLNLRRGKVTEAILQALPSASPAVQAELAHALGLRGDTSALPKLLEFATENAGSEDLRQLAVRASVRLLTQDTGLKLPSAERLQAFKKLLAAPLAMAEKRIVVAGLASITDRAGLDLTLSLIDDPAVHQEAAQAAQLQTPHHFKKTQLTDQFWDEGANFGDFNHDGKVDIVSGPFWYEAPDFKQRHEYRPATATFQRPKAGGGTETIPGFEGGLGTNNAYSDDFLTFVYDFNGDGWPDILVIGFPGTAAYWFENPKGAPGNWTSHLILDSVDNESPTFLDINGDGKPDLVCNSGGYFGYATADPSDPVKPWKFHPITPKGNWERFTHGVGVGDVNGDGRMDLLERNGWWEQPASLANDPVWTFHPFPFAPGGAAQMFAYDVNGDGLNDVITSLNPHGYGLVWWEQVRDGTNITFNQHVIVAQDEAGGRFGIHFSQMHSMALVDVDGDGLLDIVTGKRFWAHGRNGPDPESHDFPAVLYWFQLVRHANGQADFVPHLIDDDSGVGTQVVPGNIVNQEFPDIVVGNKKGTFLFTHEFQR